jgi:transcriptional regulator with XRE-family HTH domain
VRRELLKALADEETRGPDAIKQSDIARAIGVNRSVINRELRGHADISVGRIGELAWALGRRPRFELEKVQIEGGTNEAPPVPGATLFTTRNELASKRAELPQHEWVDG